MWNRSKKEEEFMPKPAGVTPAPATVPSEVAKEAIPMSSLPTRGLEPRFENSHSAVLGKSVIVKGQIVSKEDLTIDGEIEGTVELQEHRLTVGQNGKVRASVKARELVVLGTIQGNVDITDKIDIRKDAKLVGDIKTARIVIEDGAYFKGNIDIVRPEPSRQNAGAPPPKPQTAAPSAPSTPAPAMTAGAGDSKR
jgi:cytoskeletal protein CcmA (bactofilin family)